MKILLRFGEEICIDIGQQGAYSGAGFSMEGPIVVELDRYMTLM